MENSSPKPYTTQHDKTLSVRGISREEIGKLVSNFITFFLSRVVDNRDFALLVNRGKQLETFFLTKQKDTPRHGHYMFFSTKDVEDEIGHLMSLTRLSRGVEQGDFGSRHWQIRLQKEAHVRNIISETSRINFVGIESKVFSVDNVDFKESLITALVATEDSYMRTSSIKRFMKEHRRYELDCTDNNMLNLWITINRILVLSVKVGTAKSEYKSIDQQYVPLRFTMVRNNLKKNHIKYDRVWGEYEIENIQQ